MKNWLIRTRTNHILGPVSKDKVIDLLNKNSLQMEDELSSGNGFWFYVREQELITKYVYENTVQPFHPMSSLLDLDVDEELTEQESEQSSEDNQTEFINISELRKNKTPEYPEVKETQDITNVQKLDQDLLQKEVIIDEDLNSEFEAFESSPENTQSKFKLAKKVLTFNILNIILVLTIFLILFLFYYRNLILENVLGQNFNISIISTVHASDIEYDSFIKKKR